MMAVIFNDSPRPFGVRLEEDEEEKEDEEEEEEEEGKEEGEEDGRSC